MTVTPLLEIKLHIPTAPLEVIPRARLIKRLNAGLRRKLILISAPAGFGKTTLLVKWAEACGASVAWLSLDDSDNDPARFVSYLRTRLGRLLEVEEHTLVEGGSPGFLDPLLTTLLNHVIAVPGHTVLVLDRCLLITAEAVHGAAGFLLDSVPTRVHIAMAMRVGLLIS